jgi:hypothetical protein
LAKTGADAKQTAQGLADYLNSVLNRTVSKSRLSVVEEEGSSPPHFDLVRIVQKQTAPLELNGTSRLLYVQQKIEVVDGHCTTLTYSYSYQTTDNPSSALYRWEYFRHKPKDDYPYPLAHFHAEAVLTETEELVGARHFPTRRVPLELVLLHLIVECGVKPLSDDWRGLFETSIEGFDERRTAD